MICLDETNKQLIGETLRPLPRERWQPDRFDRRVRGLLILSNDVTGILHEPNEGRIRTALEVSAPRRVTVLPLTSAGRAVVERLRETVNKNSGEFFVNYSPDQTGVTPWLRFEVVRIYHLTSASAASAATRETL